MSEEKEETALNGRPKDIFDLPEGWKENILSEYEDGASDAEIKTMIRKWRGSFSNDLWNRWLLEECEFSETIITGRLLSESWWTKQGRINLHSKETFLPNLWFMNMKNRFGWADKTESKNEDTIKGELNCTLTIADQIALKHKAKSE